MPSLYLHRIGCYKRYTGALAAVLALAPTLFSQTTAADLPANCSAYDSATLPVEAEKVVAPKVFPTCDSYRSYRGIGRPVNYSKARACAWQERAALQTGLDKYPEEYRAWIVGGSLILADMYYNGAGVKRDIPLALHFACESDNQMAQLALKYIPKLDTKLPGKEPFEFCDYAATTITMNYCFSYANEIGEDHLNRYYNSVKASMPADQKAAFEKLLAAKVAYIKVHAKEVDQGGTIRGIRTMSSMNILEDLFRTDVVHNERKQFPALSPAQIASADGLLRREFENLHKSLAAQTKEDINIGAVSAENLSKVEKAWESYRDAWAAFARLRYPASADAIRAKVTRDRYRLLKTIYSYSKPPR